MRKTKRIISVILTMAMLLSLYVPVSADEATKFDEEAKKLYNIGLFKGYSNTKYEPGLEDASTRVQAIILIGRALGWDVTEYTNTDFTDVPNYAKAYVQYAVAHGITNGIGGNLFGSELPVTNMQVYTWYFRALGYRDSMGEDAWNNPYAMLRAGMITEFQYDKIDDVNQLLRDDIVGVMYESLLWKRAESENNLITELVRAQVVSAEQASKEGFVDSLPVEIEELNILSHKKVEIKFNKVIDTVKTSNFFIDRATPTSAELQADKKTVVLEFSSAIPGETLNLTTKNITSYGTLQDEVSKEFTIPQAAYMYTPSLRFANNATQLMSDGVSSAVLIFELLDKEGNVVDTDFDMQVVFTTYYGELSQSVVQIEGGKTQLILKSENLIFAVDAPIAAQITKSDYLDLVGMSDTITIEMTPTPNQGNTPVTEDNIVKVEAKSTDTLRIYFKDIVDVSEFLINSTGTIDPTKATISIRKNTKVATEGVPVAVKGFKEVGDDPKAMDVILDTDESSVNALSDNADHWMYFVDNTGENISISEAIFKVEDTTKPYIERVRTVGTSEIEVIMSEPVADQFSSFRATNVDNWVIDNNRLNSITVFGNAEITVGEFDTKTRIDKRHIITIKVEKPLNVGHSHTITVSALGDYAAYTDPDNFMEQQTVNFNVTADTTSYDKPIASLVVHSPEQWLLSFDQPIDQTVTQIIDKIQVQYYNKNSKEWLPLGRMSTFKSITDQVVDFVVTKVDSKNYVIEADIDYSAYWQPYSHGTNYYNYQYRLYLPKDVFTSSESHQTNAIQYLTAEGAMLSNDVVSPSVVNVLPATGFGNGSAYDITFSEPIKLSYLANNEGATESLLQGYTIGNEVWNNIPQGVVQFIKADNSQTIYGKIDSSFVDGYDLTIRVFPVNGISGAGTTLDDGTWNVIVQSISDDVGNTMSSATMPIVVNSSSNVSVAGAPEVKWAFADVDMDMFVQDADPLDDDNTFDYVFVKFSKPMTTTGTLRSALDPANYKLDNIALPANVLIMANIAGYDDYDNVVDSVTIRLPQGSLANDHNHQLYISQYIESTDGIALGANAISRNLPYDHNTWDVTMANDIQNEKTISSTYINNVKINRDAILTGFNVGEVSSFIGTYDLAMTYIGSLPKTSLVKEGYLSTLAKYLEEVKNHEGFDNHMGAFYYLGILNNSYLYFTMENSVINNFSGMLKSDPTTPRYSITIVDYDSYGYKVEFDKTTGRVTLPFDRPNNNEQQYEQKITIYDNLLGTRDAVYVMITDKIGGDTFTIRND